MALQAGTRLGPYEVLSLIGAGGMGEVYRARDTRLGRDVAIKVVPADRVADEDRRRRFVQEAQAASALNHPHIITIYEIESADGHDFIVMEYVPGGTLRERLSANRLPIREAIEFAIQVASALSAAHAAGIVHRDIKPENVILRPDGIVKVLDFGLAKLAPAATEMEGTETTHTVLKTNAGVVVGTAAYMAPEQARGQQVDARTDIWSVGVVLYEMVTGRCPFTGPSGIDILAAILDRDPVPLTRWDPNAPTELQRIVTKALRKDRAQRYQTAHDLLLDLQALRDELQVQARSGSASVPVSAVEGVSTFGAGGTWPYRRWVLLTGVAAVVLVGAGSIWWRLSAPQPPAEQVFREPRLVRVTAQPAEDPVRSARVSPDGRYVVFSDTAGVHVQVLASGEAHLIPHTENMDVFAWSADGVTIKAGRSDGRTYMAWDVPLLPGEPRRSGVRWPANDIVAFAPDGNAMARLTNSGEIWVEKLDGSARTRVYRTAQGGNDRTRVSALAWSYDGGRVLFAHGAAGPEVHAIAPGQDKPSVVGRLPADLTIAGLVQLPNGHVLASAWDRGGGGLWDLGEAGHSAVPKRLAAFNDGVPILPSASRDGRFVAFQHERQQADVYTAEFDASKERIDTPRRLTMDERDDLPTAWTPDGTAVLFFSSRNGRFHIFKQRVGNRTAELLVGGPTDNADPRVASDGKWVFFQQTDPEQQRSVRIMRVPIDGGQPERVHTFLGGAVPRCPARGPCMVFEFHGDQIAVRVLDPPRSSRELLRFPLSPFGEDVLPSGEGIAFVIPDAEPRNRIRIVPFDGSAPTEITVPDASALANMDWLPDGSGLLTTNLTATHTDLLFVRPNGHSTVLLSGDARGGVWAVPSRDGKRLALFMQTRQSDAFLLDLLSEPSR